MSTSTTAIAATPILASSLLAGSSYSSSSTTEREFSACKLQNGWDLKDDVFGDGGVVIGKGGVLGVSGLRDNDEDVGELARQVLAKFLIRGECGADENGSGKPGRVYIIHPAHSTTFSPEVLLSNLLPMTGGGSKGHDVTARLLARVEILRVFDFEEMGDAVAEVAERVYAEKEKGDGAGEVLVVVEGIDKFTKKVVERSDVARANALLVGLMRRVGVLARRGKGARVVVVNGGVGVGGSGGGSGRGTGVGGKGGVRTPVVQKSAAVSRIWGCADGEDRGSEGRERGSTETEEEREAGDDSDGLEVATAEPPPPPPHPEQPKYQRQNQHPSSIFLYNHVNHGRPSGLYLAFNKSLDQEIDTHLLVSRIQGQRIVEVAKDRDGDGVGRWCVWG